MSGIIGGAGSKSGVLGTTKTHFYEVGLSGTQLIAGASEDMLEFNAPTTGGNSDGWFNTSTYRYTPQKAGIYTIGICGIGWSTSGTGYLVGVAPRIRFNGSTLHTSYADLRNGDSAYVLPVHVTGLVNFNGSTDYVDFNIYIQTSSSSSYSLSSDSRTYGYYISS